MLIFFYCVYDAFKQKVVAGDNPWGPGATTLEWTLSSPPPFHSSTNCRASRKKPATDLAWGAAASLPIRPPMERNAYESR